MGRGTIQAKRDYGIGLGNQRLAAVMNRLPSQKGGGSGAIAKSVHRFGCKFPVIAPGDINRASWLHDTAPKNE
jgi:hypothetical protein